LPHSLAITLDDFGYTPFAEAGGLGKVSQVFGDELAPMFEQLNEALVA
jgi:type I restriction enzyme R subunit